MSNPYKSPYQIPYGTGGAGAAAFTSPASISGLVVWLDAADRGSTTNQWDDKSGNSNHYTSASAGNFPTFNSGAAVFNGSSTYLTGPSLASLTAGSVFMRIKTAPGESFTSNSGGFWIGTAPSDDHYTYGDTAYLGWGISQRPNCGVPSSADIWHNLSTEVSAAGAYKVHHAGALLHSSSQTPSWNTAPQIGKSKNNFWFYGDIKAVCIYNKVLSAEERTNLETYLAAL
jgi:hypothetical protein